MVEITSEFVTRQILAEGGLTFTGAEWRPELVKQLADLDLLSAKLDTDYKWNDDQIYIVKFHCAITVVYNAEFHSSEYSATHSAHAGAEAAVDSAETIHFFLTLWKWCNLNPEQVDVPTNT
jgi:hypothetical protein